MCALNSSSLPPIKLKNSQKYLVISYASPVICLMLAARETVCICQDQKHHSGHVMSAFVNPVSLSPLPPLSRLLQRGRCVFVFLQPSFSPGTSLPFAGTLVERTGRASTSRQQNGFWTPSILRWSQIQD